MKSGRKSLSKPKPTAVALVQCNFFIADDIRIEQGGKPSLLGFYPDNEIVVQMPKDLPDPTKESPVGIASLAILANFVNAVGEYDAEVEMNGAGGVPLVRADRNKLIGNKKNINFVTRFIPMPIVGFGKYDIVIKLDGHPYAFSFNVRREDAPAQQEDQVVFKSLLKKPKAAPKKK